MQFIHKNKDKVLLKIPKSHLSQFEIHTCCDKNLGANNQQLELLVVLALDLISDMRKGINVIGRGETAQNPSGVEIRPRRIS